jgi:hypothetical protein
MRSMIRLSLTLNLRVLIPVCGGLLANAAWAEPGGSDRSSGAAGPPRKANQ